MHEFLAAYPYVDEVEQWDAHPTCGKANYASRTSWRAKILDGSMLRSALEMGKILQLPGRVSMEQPPTAMNRGRADGEIQRPRHRLASFQRRVVLAKEFADSIDHACSERWRLARSFVKGGLRKQRAHYALEIDLRSSRSSYLVLDMESACAAATRGKDGLTVRRFERACYSPSTPAVRGIVRSDSATWCAGR